MSLLVTPRRSPRIQNPKPTSRPGLKTFSRQPTDAIIRAEGMSWPRVMRVLIGLIAPWRNQLITTFLLGVFRVGSLIGVGVFQRADCASAQERTGIPRLFGRNWGLPRFSRASCTGWNPGSPTIWRTDCSAICVLRSFASSMNLRRLILPAGAPAIWLVSRPTTSSWSSISLLIRSRRHLLPWVVPNRRHCDADLLWLGDGCRAGAVPGPLRVCSRCWDDRESTGWARAPVKRSAI